MSDQPAVDQGPARPGSPKVLGILSIVFGALTFLFTLMSGCMAVMGQQAQGTSSWMVRGMPNAEARAEAYKKFYESTRPATVTQTAIFSIMSLALVVIGVGQLRYRSWGRSLSVYWGAVALLCLLVTVVMSMLVIRPANQELFRALTSASGGKGLEAAMNAAVGSWAASPWVAILSALFYAPYPIVMILVFTRPRVRQAMGAG